MGQKRTKQPKPKPKAKKQSKQSKRVNVSKKVMGQLRLSPRVTTLETQMKEFLDGKANEAQFQAGIMFAVNALVDVLESKQIVTMKELQAARIKVIQEYQQEKIEEAKREAEREATAKQYKNDPVHYDTTIDKWFVFAPNWKDRIGPFMDESAARNALKIIQSPVPEPPDRPAESQEEEPTSDHTDPPLEVVPVVPVPAATEDIPLEAVQEHPEPL